MNATTIAESTLLADRLLALSCGELDRYQARDIVSDASADCLDRTSAHDLGYLVGRSGHRRLNPFPLNSRRFWAYQLGEQHERLDCLVDWWNSLIAPLKWHRHQLS